MTTRIANVLADQVRVERARRRWTQQTLAARAGVSRSAVQAIESGELSSVEGYVRLGVALGLTPSFALANERGPRAPRDADPVHAAMAEVEARHLGNPGHEVLLDEPYQHYQFAGRADLLAVNRAERALLHIENRTRFPDIQAFVGSYNAKRAYLIGELAKRLGLPGGFRSVTNVVVALWSSEVLHSLRLREMSFRSVCPDGPESFEAWWSGRIPDAGVTSALVVFDPIPGRRSSRRRWVGLDRLRSVDPRYRGYADALEVLRRAGLA